MENLKFRQDFPASRNSGTPLFMLSIGLFYFICDFSIFRKQNKRGCNEIKFELHLMPQLLFCFGSVSMMK